jgi:hypothetical protein
MSFEILLESGKAVLIEGGAVLIVECLKKWYEHRKLKDRSLKQFKKINQALISSVNLGLERIKNEHDQTGNLELKLQFIINNPADFLSGVVIKKEAFMNQIADQTIPSELLDNLFSYTETCFISQLYEDAINSGNDEFRQLLVFQVNEFLLRQYNFQATSEQIINAANNCVGQLQKMETKIDKLLSILSRNDDPQVLVRKYLTNLTNLLNQEGPFNEKWRSTLLDYSRDLRYYIIPTIKTVNSNKINNEKFDVYIDRWLMQDGQPCLAILGDSGLGKTTACGFIAQKQLNRISYGVNIENTGQIPILLPLADLSKKGLLNQSIYAILNQIVDSEFTESIIETITKENGFLFILDGFDEIANRADFDEIYRKINLIKNKFSLKKSRIILTCRTHFFAARKEINNLLRNGYGFESDAYTLEPSFNVIEIQKLSNKEIEKFIEKREPKEANKIVHEIFRKDVDRYNLPDLAKTPLLLIFIIYSLQNELLKRKDMNDSSTIDRALIYERYTNQWFNRESLRRWFNPANVDDSTKKLIAFCDELALEMWRQGTISITIKELKSAVQENFKNACYADLTILDYNTRTTSILNRDGAGSYKFIHKSIMEFFVAKKALELLSKGSVKYGIEKSACWDVKSFEFEIASFMGELLQHKKYKKHIQLLANLCLTTENEIVLWNAVHIISTIEKDRYRMNIKNDIVPGVYERANIAILQKRALPLRQYIRLIAKFGNQDDAQRLISQLVDICKAIPAENEANNQKYIDYYYGRHHACEALLRHLSTESPKYDRELHIYLLGEIAMSMKYAKKLRCLSFTWANDQHIKLANSAIQKIELRMSGKH